MRQVLGKLNCHWVDRIKPPGTEGFPVSVAEGCSRFELFFMSASMDY